jgi:hypothetical protein
MMRRVVFIILAVVGVALFLVIAVPLGYLFYKGGVDRPIQFEVPEGYRGWAELYYDDPTCPPLRTRGIFRVVPISAEGRGCAPEGFWEGWTHIRFVSVSPDGTRTSTEGHVHGSDPKRRRFLLFIGTEEEMNRSQPPYFPQTRKQ